MKKIFYICTLFLLIYFPVSLPGQTKPVADRVKSNLTQNYRILNWNIHSADIYVNYLISCSIVDGRCVSEVPPVSYENIKNDQVDKYESAVISYQENIKSKIESKKKYPENAKKRGVQGSVDVSFTVYPDGKCKDIKIFNSSRFPILDNAAIDTVNSAAPFPQFPEKITNEYIQMIVSIVFKND